MLLGLHFAGKKKSRLPAAWGPFHIRTPTVSVQGNRKTLPARELGRGGALGPALLAESGKPARAAASLEGSEGRKRARPRAEGHSAPDGAAVPRARAWASRETGKKKKGTTGSARWAQPPVPDIKPSGMFPRGGGATTGTGLRARGPRGGKSKAVP